MQKAKGAEQLGTRVSSRSTIILFVFYRYRADKIEKRSKVEMFSSFSVMCLLSKSMIAFVTLYPSKKSGIRSPFLYSIIHLVATTTTYESRVSLRAVPSWSENN